MKILYSDRIEDLADDLKARLLRDKAGSDPFKFVSIVVPNANIAKWLQMRVFAAEKSLCAGVSFPFMEQRLTELMRANLEEPEKFELLPDHAYAQAIMRILLAEDTDAALRISPADWAALAPFRAYVMGGAAGAISIDRRKQAQMAWQLADKLANLMDTYEVRRPEVVDAWLGRAPSGRNPVHVPDPRPDSAEAGEAALARALWGDDGIYPDCGNRLSLRQLFGRVQASPPKGPRQTIYFFGQSTLTLLQVRILTWLSRTHEVVFYHNNPCGEYWGDIETERERHKALFGVDTGHGEGDPEKRSAGEEYDPAIENPLLTKFGIAGRETLRLLVDLEEESAGICDFTWEHVGHETDDGKATVLSRLQESIRRRTSEVEKLPQDASLQIVGTPGIRREVEMVYNSILGSVCRPKGVEGERPWNDCTFSDIAVLVPDMKTYRPVIESVFDARGQVPYGLIDTGASEDSQYLAGFLALMELKRRGLTRETLFAVLENPCVQTALGFTREDVATWRELTKTLGAFDGFERKDADDCFCWDWALARLRLGQVADALGVEEGAEEALPLVARGGSDGLKLSETVELLYRELKAALENKDGSPRRLLCADAGNGGGEAVRPATWARVLGHLASEFLAVPKDDQLEESVRMEIMRTLNGLAGIAAPQVFELPVAAVEYFVGGVACRKGGYLTHGVTVAGLQPMRPVPFRQVYVLGLGAGGFPGRTSSSTLDIRGAGWRLGDVSLPNTNRYLFLETLMAVKDRLVLSYPCRDIEKDAELFPSSIVSELESFIGTSIVNDEVMNEKTGKTESAGFREFRDYPLLEHGEAGMDGVALAKSSVCPIVWDKSDPFAGILPTYSAAARKLARRRNGICGDDPRDCRDWKKDEPRTPEYTARELADFLRSPLRAVLIHRFGIAVEGYQDSELDPDSPLGIEDGRLLNEIQSAWLENDLQGAEETVRRLQISGRAPTGLLGDFAIKKLTDSLRENTGELKAFLGAFGDASRKQTKSGRTRIRFLTGDAVAEKYFSVGQPYWFEEENDVSVLVCGRLPGNGDMPLFPVERTLEALITFVIDTAGRADGDSRSLRIGLADVWSGKHAVWRWTGITPQIARNYLALLTDDYENYLEAGGNGLPVIEYGKLAASASLAEYLSGGETEAPDRESLLARILRDATKSVFFRNGGKVTFNGNLVIQKIIDGFATEPDTELLRSWIEGRYAIPLQGAAESNGDAR